ncbi:FAD-dependent monooxygenase [Pokkaliibacter sp. MBI-7]|uniref:FAD-dependent monooxygenase n=1 Tax=Pokkaliibacter sp. MBI-7 TaxID=3040600 RepID=UPI00244B2EEB|nr:FAD-dependent monooxygenase [Pokkaliibacter sp. MBI-7]MDH2435955.1 FAD-dependent monooxygenase [Pokkaliibacter sp. MBI-7]
MQYHIEDYRSGDPDIKLAAEGLVHSSTLPKETDVLIIGSGPTGLTLAAQLSAFSDIRTCIVEQRSGPLERGHADGIACRTVEMFNAFGFSHKVLREACWVNELNFWRTHEETSKGIYRSGQVRDTEEGLSEFPHVILNQARVQELFLDVMRNSPNRSEPYYGRALITIRTDESEYPVIAELEHKDENGEIRKEIIRAKYLVGTDGARSTVRKELNLELKGDSANQAWGVMDILAVTDFPDNRMKAIISSPGDGTVVLIPREGGYLFRVYVEMDKLGEGERVKTRTFDAQDLISAANKVFYPYSLDVRHVAWWSVYEIGQRMTDRFDDLSFSDNETAIPKIFIAGDAGHTHSPKAGQGMNVSMQDAFNLGWKLAAVLQGRSPEALLRTYNSERHAIAKDLINFDREWTTLLHQASKGDQTVNAEDVQTYFTQSGRYTAGTATQYTPSILTGSSRYQDLATGFQVGKRFHSSPIVRLSDAKPMHLGHVIEADGRWRLFAFSPQKQTIAESLNALNGLCEFLKSSTDSPIVRYTPKTWETDSVLDVRAIIPYYFRDIGLSDIHDFLLPRKGKFALRDYEKVFCFGENEDTDIYLQRGINIKEGCLILVRPDQYISHILPFNATEELSHFISKIFVQQN